MKTSPLHATSASGANVHQDPLTLLTRHDTLWRQYAKTGSREDYRAFAGWIDGLSIEALQGLAFELGKRSLDREKAATP